MVPATRADYAGLLARWLNTVAFFVGATFVTGAILFTGGAVASCLANPIVVAITGVHIPEWQEF